MFEPYGIREPRFVDQRWDDIVVLGYEAKEAIKNKDGKLNSFVEKRFLRLGVHAPDPVQTLLALSLTALIDRHDA